MGTWVQVAAIGTPLLVAALGLVGTVWLKMLSRSTEDAAARKVHAEAVSIEVATARGLVDEVVAMMAHQRTDYEARLTATRNELAAVAERIRVTEERQQAFMSAVAAHTPWDEAAWRALQALHPAYPPPPPLSFDAFTVTWRVEGE